MAPPQPLSEDLVAAYSKQAAKGSKSSLQSKLCPIKRKQLEPKQADRSAGQKRKSKTAEEADKDYSDDEDG